MCSDGKTPGEKANQILAFVPILPGQKLSEMPPRRPSTRTPAQSYSEIPKLQDESLTSSDLIDFGEDHHNGTAPKPDTSTTVHPTRPSQNNQALLLDLDDHPPAHSSHQGTNKPKGPAPVIRHDTETSDTEEFVDAQEDSLI